MQLNRAPLNEHALNGAVDPVRIGHVRAIGASAAVVRAHARPPRVRVAVTAARLRVIPRPRQVRVHPRPATVRPRAPEA